MFTSTSVHAPRWSMARGRDCAMFTDWFEIELQSAVEDLYDFEIVDEEV